MDEMSGHRSAGSGDGRRAVHTVYVMEDHEHVRRALVDMLDAADDMRVVGESPTASTGLDDIRHLRPAVAVIDGNLGGESGLDVCRTLSVDLPEVSCVILTNAAGTAWDRQEAAAAGAVAYLIKEVRGFDLIDVIRRVAAGERPIDDRQIGRRSRADARG